MHIRFIVTVVLLGLLPFGPVAGAEITKCSDSDGTSRLTCEGEKLLESLQRPFVSAPVFAKRRDYLVKKFDRVLRRLEVGETSTELSALRDRLAIACSKDKQSCRWESSSEVLDENPICLCNGE